MSGDASIKLDLLASMAWFAVRSQPPVGEFNMTPTVDVTSIFRKLGIPLPGRALVGGNWILESDHLLATIDPATGEVLAKVSTTTPALVDRAIEVARAASKSWSRSSVRRRCAILERIAAVMLDNVDDLARLETLDTGKPLHQSLTDVRGAVEYFSFYGRNVGSFFGRSIPISEDLLAVVHREPFGVVAHILPWNAPISQFARGAAPSLAVGNAIVVKPSELAPLSSLALAELIQRVTPGGLVNVVPGDGAVTGDALASHPGIDHVTFTGSVATGVTVSRAAAANVVACNLELGGKSGAIVFPDADLDLATRSASGALVRNSGQSCSALTRFIVHSSVQVEFIERVKDHVSRFTLGHGLTDADIGPLISEKQRGRVLTLIDSAVKQGATIETGSISSPNDERLRCGFFVSPTVLSGVTSDMVVATEEIFGPVQSIMSFDTESDAERIINSTPYGLAAAVFTKDIDVANRLAQRINAGQVHINGYTPNPEIPFGGVKRSGYGREKGFDAFYGYTQAKSVVTHIQALPDGCDDG